MKKHVTITIHGNLKNSGFRFSAVEKGIELDLVGQVKEYDKKSLTINIEGEMEQLQKFLKWCHVGPKKAKIDKVDFESSEELQNYEHFTADWYK